MGTKVRTTGDHWEVEFRSAEEGAKMPRIIKAIHGGKTSRSLRETLKDILTTEPVRLVSAILSGVIAGFLLWYFGLT